MPQSTVTGMSIRSLRFGLRHFGICLDKRIDRSAGPYSLRSHIHCSSACILRTADPTMAMGNCIRSLHPGFPHANKNSDRNIGKSPDSCTRCFRTRYLSANSCCITCHPMDKGNYSCNHRSVSRVRNNYCRGTRHLNTHSYFELPGKQCSRIHNTHRSKNHRSNRQRIHRCHNTNQMSKHRGTHLRMLPKIGEERIRLRVAS